VVTVKAAVALTGQRLYQAVGAALLTRRYGARDVGLEYYRGPGHAHLSAEVVTHHAARYFATPAPARSGRLLPRSP
jgi:hypothetical protein